MYQSPSFFLRRIAVTIKFFFLYAYMTCHHYVCTYVNRFVGLRCMWSFQTTTTWKHPHSQMVMTNWEFMSICVPFSLSTPVSITLLDFVALPRVPCGTSLACSSGSGKTSWICQKANIVVVARRIAAWNCYFSVKDFTPFVALRLLRSLLSLLQYFNIFNVKENNQSPAACRRRCCIWSGITNLMLRCSWCR